MDAVVVHWGEDPCDGYSVDTGFLDAFDGGFDLVWIKRRDLAAVDFEP